MTRFVGMGTSCGFALVALLHLLWLVSPWPMRTWNAWSLAFGGPSFRVSAPIMAGVALLFAVAAYLVAECAGVMAPRLPERIVRVGVGGIAFVCIARAVIGFIEMSRTIRNPATSDAFRHTISLYLTIYLPVFLVLGIGSAMVAASSMTRTR